MNTMRNVRYVERRSGVSPWSIIGWIIVAGIILLGVAVIGLIALAASLPMP